nr:hypothetical protein [Tanacetum cinerariifolium]
YSLNNNEDVLCCLKVELIWKELGSSVLLAACPKFHSHEQHVANDNSMPIWKLRDMDIFNEHFNFLNYVCI